MQLLINSCCRIVDREEVDRLRKRFMKLDKVRDCKAEEEPAKRIFGLFLLFPVGLLAARDMDE